jgi:hypothetical protein
MSWLRPSRRIGVSPDRLVVARKRHRWTTKVEATTYPVSGDPAAALADLKTDGRITLTLSSHLVRYCVVPSSPALRRADDWQAYAAHLFGSTYGAAATGWHIRVATGPARGARLASAVDRGLVEALRSTPGVASIQPYLMSAFNTRRRLIGNECAWFVLHEPGRLTYALVAKGEWRLIRRRRVGDDWQVHLPPFLDRESAALAEPACRTVFLVSESQPTSAPAPYEVVDITLPLRTDPSLRPYAMALH